MKIIKYVSNEDIDIEFQDEFHYRTRCQYHNFKEGLVKNYYARNTYGVGYLGNLRDLVNDAREGFNTKYDPFNFTGGIGFKPFAPRYYFK